MHLLLINPVAGCVTLVALGLLLGSCGQASDSQKAVNTPSKASAPSPAQPPVPAATSSEPKPNHGETAKASDQPMKSMSKDEEAKSMPRPGQANDHSTLAKDPKS